MKCHTSKVCNADVVTINTNCIIYDSTKNRFRKVNGDLSIMIYEMTQVTNKPALCTYYDYKKQQLFNLNRLQTLSQRFTYTRTKTF